jgi:hypothetical protein
MRTTLYSRLKPEYMELIESKSKDYPFTYNSIVDSLKRNRFYSYLTVCQVTDITCFVGLFARSNSDWGTGKDLFLTEDEVA